MDIVSQLQEHVKELAIAMDFAVGVVHRESPQVKRKDDPVENQDEIDFHKKVNDNFATRRRSKLLYPFYYF